MLKMMTRPGRLMIVATAVAVFGGLIASSSALAFGPPFSGPPPAPTLNGDWAPYNRCPVDSPAMLSADGEARLALCAAVSSPSGSFTVGHVTAPLGASDVQMGLVLTSSAEPEDQWEIVSPPGGAVVGSPTPIPGGLPALVCPSTSRFLEQVCRGRSTGVVDYLTATVTSAGAPSDFNLEGAFGLEASLITVPVKLHLENPLLGGGCYIGSNSEPIVLHPHNLSFPQLGLAEFETNGTPDTEGPMLVLSITGSSEGDSTLAIPGANGCGFGGWLDSAIDRNLTLPSPSGNNSVVLNETASDLALFADPSSLVPNEGRDLASAWHSAVQSGH
jgi:hypothetical protein